MTQVIRLGSPAEWGILTLSRSLTLIPCTKSPWKTKRFWGLGSDYLWRVIILPTKAFIITLEWIGFPEQIVVSQQRTLRIEAKEREIWVMGVAALAGLWGMLWQVVPGCMESRMLNEGRNLHKCQQVKLCVSSNFPSYQFYEGESTLHPPWIIIRPLPMIFIN